MSDRATAPHRSALTYGLRLLILLGAVSVASSCINDEDVFIGDRLENLCDSNIPVCNKQASCLLKDSDFFRGEFPGGLRVISRSRFENADLIARFMFTEELYPGTEMQVRTFTADCSDFTEEHPVNVDIFRLAGDDLTLEFQMHMPGLGDHLVEIFSDMSATYLMTLSIEER